MEKCPGCGEISLEHDLHYSVARCTWPGNGCGFREKVKDHDDYFSRFELSELNWSNYCAQTPEYVRKIRGTLAPLKPGEKYEHPRDREAREILERG